MRWGLATLSGPDAYGEFRHPRDEAKIRELLLSGGT